MVSYVQLQEIIYKSPLCKIKWPSVLTGHSKQKTSPYTSMHVMETRRPCTYTLQSFSPQAVISFQSLCGHPPFVEASLLSASVTSLPSSRSL